MPVCSYLVFPAAGARDDVAARLSAVPGCEVTVAENSDVLVLVTDTPDPASDDALRTSIESVAGIECLMLAFGEIDPTAGAPRPTLPDPPATT